MNTTLATEFDTHNRIKRTYDGLGLPLNWREIEQPCVKEAIRRFVDRDDLTADQLAVLVDFCDYYIHAPRWTQTSLYTGNMPPAAQLAALCDLRRRIKLVTTVEQLAGWLLCCHVDAFLEPIGELPAWIRREFHVDVDEGNGAFRPTDVDGLADELPRTS